MTNDHARQLFFVSGGEVLGVSGDGEVKKSHALKAAIAVYLHNARNAYSDGERALWLRAIRTLRATLRAHA